jgi:phospholipid/cholesterol/gamma-HCH transport system substrate-binding protein
MSRAFRVGIFVVATLLMFGAGVFWIGSRKFLFNSTYRLYADFPTVAGLSDGGDVRVGGVRQGTVRHVYLPHTPDQKVRVQMDLKMPTRDVVKRDSLAAIRTEGLVGDQYVEISFGSTEAPRVSNGDTIGAQPPIELADLLKKTNGILDSAKGAVDNLGGTAGNLNAISSKINRGSGSVGALINDRSIYEHVDAAAAELQEDTEALKHNFLTRGFFKKRGYEDETELTRYAIRALPAGAYEKRFVYPGNKLFDKQDSAKAKKAKLLDEAGAYLQQHPYGLAVITAYAGQKGDTDKQRELTLARAMVAREYLVDHFKLDDTRVRTLGGGKNPNAMDGGQVEVLVYQAPENVKSARAK